MKKVIVTLVCLFFVCSTASAFLYEIKFLTPQELKELTNEELVATFIEVKIEEKASAEFHEGAGFSSAKEYYKRKDLLRFIIYIHQEMKMRGLEPDPIDRWLK